MSLLNVITTVGSLAGSINQARSQNAALRQAARERQAALDALNQQANEAQKMFQQRQASGAYNPSEALKLQSDISSRNLGNAIRQYSSQLANLGYKAGDSAFNQGNRRLSENALLQDRMQQLAIRDQFAQREMQDFGAVNQYRTNANQARLGASGQMFNQVQQMPGGNLGATIAALTQSGLVGGAQRQLNRSVRVPSGALPNVGPDVDPNSMYDLPEYSFRPGSRF